MMPPLPRSAIGAERGVAEPQDGGHQHLEHRGLLLDGVVEEALLEAEAGVVDEEVDRSLAVGQARLDQGQLVAVDEVGDEHLDRDAVGGAQLGGDGLEALGVAGDEDEVVAAGGELDGRTRGRCRRWRR